MTGDKLANLIVGEKKIRIAVTDDIGMEHAYLLRHKGETIDTADLAAGAVTSSKLADGAVTAAHVSFITGSYPQSTPADDSTVLSAKAVYTETEALKSDITDLQAALIGVSNLIGG